MAYAGLIVGALAQEQFAVSKAEAAAFNSRMFGGQVFANADACFVRRYDADHPAQYPKQTVSAMKLLVEANDEPEDKTINYSFRVGVQYRNRPGDFDSGGYRDLVIASEARHDVQFACNPDCDGRGMTIALSKDNESAIMRLGRLVVSKRGKPVTTRAKRCRGSPTTRYFASISQRSANAPNL